MDEPTTRTTGGPSVGPGAGRRVRAMGLLLTLGLLALPLLVVSQLLSMRSKEVV